MFFAILEYSILTGNMSSLGLILTIDAFLVLGLIDICELKYQKTGKEIFKIFSEKLTEGFNYE